MKSSLTIQTKRHYFKSEYQAAIMVDCVRCTEGCITRYEWKIRKKMRKKVQPKVLTTTWIGFPLVEPRSSVKCL